MRILEPVQDWIERWPFFAVLIALAILIKIFQNDFFNRSNPLNKIYVQKTTLQ